MKKLAMAVAVVAGAALLGGCYTRQTRVEGDFGTSHRLAVFNQTLSVEAEKNLETVEGLDGRAAMKNVDKYRETFGKEKQATTYTINIGDSRD